MPVLADRVQESTTTGGTGTLTLAGAVTGYRSFAQAFSIGDITYYTIDDGAGNWEIGVGTVGSGTLSRDSVLESSNANALVNFSAGTKRVFCSAPTKVLIPDQASNSGKVLTTNGTDPAWTTTLNDITLGNITPGSGAFTTLSASSTVSGTGFSTYLASPPAIGGTTPAAGAFTTLSSTGNTTLGDAAGDTLTINAGTTTFAQGTANGVLYLNGSKVLTTGTGLVFDGTNLGIGITSPASYNSAADNLVLGGGGDNGLTIVSGSSSQGSLFFADGASGGAQQAAGYLVYVHTSDYMALGTANTERLRIDSSGNLGLGVTPSAWSIGKAIQLAGSSATASMFQNSAGSLYLSNNYAYISGDKYVADGYATRYGQYSGQHVWQTAPSGTAGNPITFTQAMTLTSKGLLVGYTSDSGLSGTGNAIFSGNVGIGTSSPGAKLTIEGGTSADQFRLGTGTNYYKIGRESASTGYLCFYGTQAGATGYVFGGIDGDRMIINSSGNLGLGVTPSAWGTWSSVLQGNAYALTGYNVSGNVQAALWCNSYRNSGGTNTYYSNGFATQYLQTSGAHQWRNAPSGTAGNAITFTQAMTLDASGNLGVGETNPQAKIHATGGVTGFYRSSTAGTNFFSTFSSGSSGDTYYSNVYGTGQYILRCEYRGGNVGSITTNGSTITFSGNALSDARWKENTAKIENALSAVNSLDFVTFTFKDSGRKSAGVTSQQSETVPAIAPFVVNGASEDDYKAFDYNALIGYLGAAIQELHAEIESLKAKVN